MIKTNCRLLRIYLLLQIHTASYLLLLASKLNKGGRKTNISRNGVPRQLTEEISEHLSLWYYVRRNHFKLNRFWEICRNLFLKIIRTPYFPSKQIDDLITWRLGHGKIVIQIISYTVDLKCLYLKQIWKLKLHRNNRPFFA